MAKIRVSAAEEARYIVCPASGILHPPTALVLQPYKNDKQGCFAVCSCLTRIFINSRFWKKTSGYTAPELRKRGIKVPDMLV